VIEIPLCTREGVLLATTVIDDEDEHFADHTWRLASRGYARRTIKVGGKPITLYLAREIAQPPAGMLVSHFNGDLLDNRRENLRIVTWAQAGQNAPSHRGSSSRFRGVSWDAPTQKWRAQVWLDGRLHYLGSFDREEYAAAAARDFRLANLPYTNEDRSEAS
jgi:hypothetical protein